MSSDTVQSSIEYFDNSGNRTRMKEIWWNNGWYTKMQYFDTSGFLYRKTLMINDSAYYVETTYELDDRGNIITEYTKSSKGENFIMAYKNEYENSMIKAAKMMFINRDKEDKKPPRGIISYSYDEYGRLVKKDEKFSDEKDISTSYTYYNKGMVRTEQRKDHLNDKEFVIEYNYNEDDKISLTRTLSADEVTSVTSYSYQNKLLVRQETALPDGTKQIVMFFQYK